MQYTEISLNLKHRRDKTEIGKKYVFDRNVFEGLESRTQYRYRLKCMNDFGSSAWSAVVNVSTTKKPQTSEDLQRAVTKGDVETVKNILPGEHHNQFSTTSKKVLLLL